MSFRTKKRYGQHFLIDKNIIQKIIKAISPLPDDLIVEIGPGKGALTEALYHHTKNLVLVEIDSELIEELRNKFPDLRIINKDILECDFRSEFFDSKFRIVGNIPYYITSQIIFKIFDNYKIVKDAVFMIQKEVAERIISKTGSKSYGILSVFAQLYSEPEIIFNVSKNVFYPRPEVESSVLRLKIKDEIPLTSEEEKLFRIIVKAAFNQRRKTLRNSLQKIFSNISDDLKTKFFKLDFDFSIRPEEITLNDFFYLAKSFAELKSTN